MNRLLFAALAFAFASASPAWAETLRFPKTGPAFVINQPAGWSHSDQGDGTLVMASPDGAILMTFAIADNAAGRTIDEEASYTASKAGAGRPEKKAAKVISGHFGHEYDAIIPDSARGRVRLHYFFVAMNDGRYAGAMTMMPETVDAGRRAEAEAIYDGVTITGDSTSPLNSWR